MLYFQNFTALNAYFKATGTTPIDTVGGEWPELGFKLPLPADDDADGVLPAGTPISVYDAILAFRHEPPQDERDVARRDGARSPEQGYADL